MRNIVKNLIALSMSQYYKTGVKILANIVTARVLGPELKGVWSALNIICNFGRYYDLGIMAAMRRKLPILNVQGKVIEAQNLKNTVFTINVIVSILIGFCLILFLFFKGSDFEVNVRVGIVAMIGILLLSRVSFFSTDYLLANRRFVELAKINAFQVTSTAILSVILVFKVNIYGIYIAEVMGWSVFCFYGVWRIKPTFQISISLKELFGHMQVGFPLMLLALGWTSFQMCDRMVIIKELSIESLGLYSIATLGISVLQIAPNVIKSVIQPEILRQYAKNNHNPYVLKKYSYRPVYFVAILMAILVGCVYLVLPQFVTQVLPSYASGIKSAQILLIGGFFLGLSLVSQQVLTATKRFRPMVAVMLSCIAINVMLNVIVVRLGYGIEGVSLSTVVSYFFYTVAINKLVIIDLYEVSFISFICYLVKATLPLCYVLAFILIAEKIVDEWTLYLSAVLFAVYIVYLFPLYCFAFGFIKSIRN